MTLLTVEYIHPPAVSVSLSATALRAVTGVLATVASLSVSGGIGFGLCGEAHCVITTKALPPLRLPIR